MIVLTAIYLFRKASVWYNRKKGLQLVTIQTGHETLVELQTVPVQI